MTVLTLYCLNIVYQHLDVETCSKTCASFMPVCLRLYLHDNALYLGDNTLKYDNILPSYCHANYNHDNILQS